SQLLGVDRFLATNYKIINPVFNIFGAVRLSSKKPIPVGFIFGKEKIRFLIILFLKIETTGLKFRMFSYESACVVSRLNSNLGTVFFASPCPNIAKPQRRKQINRGRFRAAVMNGNFYKQVRGANFCIFNKYIKIAVVFENPGVGNLVFSLRFISLLIGLNQIIIGKGLLGIFVEILHIGMGGRVIKVIIQLLDVLTVVALTVSQTKQSLFQDGII